MANPKGNIGNLSPVRTKEEAKKRGKNGGVKSGVARAEKKLMSDIYLRALAAKYNITIEPEIRAADTGKIIKQKVQKVLQGNELYDYVFGRIFERCDSVTASVFKDIAATTEGQKHVLSQDPKHPLDMTINIIGVKSDDKKPE